MAGTMYVWPKPGYICMDQENDLSLGGGGGVGRYITVLSLQRPIPVSLTKFFQDPVSPSKSGHDISLALQQFCSYKFKLNPGLHEKLDTKLDMS